MAVEIPRTGWGWLGKGRHREREYVFLKEDFILLFNFKESLGFFFFSQVLKSNFTKG